MGVGMAFGSGWGGAARVESGRGRGGRVVFTPTTDVIRFSNAVVTLQTTCLKRQVAIFVGLFWWRVARLERPIKKRSAPKPLRSMISSVAIWKRLTLVWWRLGGAAISTTAARFETITCPSTMSTWVLFFCFSARDHCANGQS